MQLKLKVPNNSTP